MRFSHQDGSPLQRLRRDACTVACAHSASERARSAWQVGARAALATVRLAHAASAGSTASASSEDAVPTALGFPTSADESNRLWRPTSRGERISRVRKMMSSGELSAYRVHYR